MATEEVNKPPSLPSYPEMILAAIEGLNSENGSNKSSISRYIESKYGQLPAGHSALLSHHLNKMKESGELVFFKNNYMKYDPDAPPKRGRGRPPKPRIPMPPGMVLSSGKPRGRPPKDPSASGPSESGKPRGRPPKKPRVDGESSTKTSTGRPRGRPPKVKPSSAEETLE
ncbi:HMG-Y-related protein A-like [Malania oleifera]|uniref:HMG-Y-related protein A-like n=1 Tax=Malania oleifera TaxID=397392 RepID=UPI0025AE645D|nr:HMG-Y-related protein A-like [Malania oleifera]